MDFNNVTGPTTESTTTEALPGVVDVAPGAWGVAIALTVLVTMALCLIVLYVKARRRRAAESGRRQSIRAISGGVVMATNAYQNYGQRVQEYVGRHPSLDAPPVFVENPPSYEDAMRHANTNYATGIVNLSYSGSNMNLVHNTNPQPVPPPYSPSVENLQEEQQSSEQRIEPASTSGQLQNLEENKKDTDKKTVDVDESATPDANKDILVEPRCSSEEPTHLSEQQPDSEVCEVSQSNSPLESLECAQSTDDDSTTNNDNTAQNNEQ